MARPSRRTLAGVGLAALTTVVAVGALTAAPASARTHAAVTSASAVAAATPGVSAAVAAFKNGESVYVSPDAGNLISSAEADQLRAQIRDTNYPFFVAVLPKSDAVGGSSSATLDAIHSSLNVSGTYALFIGDGTSNAFKAGDTSTSVSTEATVAYRDYKDQGAYAVLSNFITAAAPIVTGSGSTGGTGTGDGTVTGDGGLGVDTGTGTTSSFPVGGLLAVLGVGALAVGGIGYAGYRASSKATAARTAEVRTTVDEDVTEFGEKVAALDVEDKRLDDAGRTDAQTALDAYEKAKTAADAMRRPEDAAAVTTVLEDGRFAMACVTARLAGQPLPERRPPCFVDPRHGPSVTDVQWAPDGGAPRPIPVCQACSVTLAQGRLPAAREVEVSGQRVPYWAAGRAYAPYAGGYYGGSGADLLGAIFVGSMLGGAFSQPGGGWGGNDFGANNGGGIFQGGGGDFGGGGGFGGGDFGGGGGGGDFGGGGSF
jgi:hypothetical protein